MSNPVQTDCCSQTPYVASDSLIDPASTIVPKPGDSHAGSSPPPPMPDTTQCCVGPSCDCGGDCGCKCGCPSNSSATSASSIIDAGGASPAGMGSALLKSMQPPVPAPSAHVAYKVNAAYGNLVY